MTEYAVKLSSTRDAGGDWWRGARVWGYLTAAAFLSATLVWAMEALGLLGEAPQHVETSAGRLADEAAWWAGYFDWRHETLWNPLLRNALFIVAYLGTVPLMLALARATGLMAARVAAAYTGIAAVFGILQAIAFLGATDYWRDDGWGQVPDEIMVVVGRDTQVLDQLSTWAGLAGFAVLALALGHAAVAIRHAESLPQPLARLAWVGTGLLAAMVVLSVAQVDLGLTLDLLSLAAGAVFAPVFFVALGRSLGR